MPDFQKAFAAIFLLVLALPLVAQYNQAEAVYRAARHVELRQYVPDERYEQVVFASRFSKDDIRQLRLSNRQIYKIDLVYTAFREDPNFDQEALNLARFQQLMTVNPQLADDELISWQVVSQTGCKSSPACVDFFHGFVIYYNKLYTKADTRREIDSVELRLRHLEQQIQRMDSLKEYHVTEYGCEFPVGMYSDEYVADEFNKFYNCDTKFKGRLSFVAQADDKGRVTDVKVVERLYRQCNPAIERALKMAVRWKQGFLIDGQKHPFSIEGTIDFPIKSGSIRFERYLPADETKDQYQIALKGTECQATRMDSTFRKMMPYLDQDAVSKVLLRNRWQPSLFVVDVTGSMHPYTADLLRWFRVVMPTATSSWVFFNDGNDQPDEKKVIGRTGGIYTTYTSYYTVIKERMYECMRNGGGGDLMENNVEALLQGLKMPLGQGEMVMVADNFSFPRDAALLEGVKQPLRIILCGTTVGLNTDYMDLARKHGFTLHTATSDLTDLSRVQPGERISVDGHSYLLTPDGFRKMLVQ